MDRRPPLAAHVDATLFDKYPHLKAAWQHSPDKDRKELFTMHGKLSRIHACTPIDWSKPESFTQAEHACGEAVATSSILHKLATLAHDDSMDYEAGHDEGHRNDLLYNLQALEKMMMPVQLELETLEAVSEYRWLQANVNGDFSAMPRNWRIRYTETPYLLDNRFERIKGLADDPQKLAKLEGAADYALAHATTRLDMLEEYMLKAGPLFANDTRETSHQSVMDYNSCIGELIPHIRSQLQHMQAQLPSLGRHATLEMATKRKAQDGHTSKISYLPVSFRPPDARYGEGRPDPKNVTDITRGLLIRAEKEKGV